MVYFKFSARIKKNYKNNIEHGYLKSTKSRYRLLAWNTCLNTMHVNTPLLILYIFTYMRVARIVFLVTGSKTLKVTTVIKLFFYLVNLREIKKHGLCPKECAMPQQSFYSCDIYWRLLRAVFRDLYIGFGIFSKHSSCIKIVWYSTALFYKQCPTWQSGASLTCFVSCIYTQDAVRSSEQPIISTWWRL